MFSEQCHIMVSATSTATACEQLSRLLTHRNDGNSMSRPLAPKQIDGDVFLQQAAGMDIGHAWLNCWALRRKDED